MVAYDEQQQQPEADDGPEDGDHAVVAGKDVALRTDDGNAPFCALQRAVEDECIATVDDGLHHTASSCEHGTAQSLDVALCFGCGVAEDSLAEEFRGIGMHQIFAVASHHDGRRVRVWLQCGHSIRETLQIVERMLCQRVCLVHDALDTLGGIVQELCGVFDGCALDMLLTTVEQDIEQQRESDGDDERDDQSEA